MKFFDSGGRRSYFEVVLHSLCPWEYPPSRRVQFAAGPVAFLALILSPYRQ